MPEITIHQEGRLHPGQEKSYVHLPFDVPVGAVRLEVEFQYSDRIGSDPYLTGGNTIDLGLFDEGGIDFLQAGFRGWSGSERDRFFITATEATPGYLPGPLNPGRWNVLLGLYKIAPQGCAYQASMTITTGTSDGGTIVPAHGVGDLPASPPPAPFSPWLRGELHCHTWHSDGELDPAELVQLARSRGLDFLAVTDHNTTAGQRALENLSDPGLILIRGVESTTFKGHFNVWGISDWIDFRVQNPEEMEAVVRYANERGGITSCGHPKPYGPNWDFASVTNYQCIEVWNGPWVGLDELSLGYWLEQIAAGRRIPAVGGSDYHRAGESEGDLIRNLGTPTNWVYIDGPHSAATILEAVRRGHVSLADQPDGPLLDLRGGVGYEVMAGDATARPITESLPIRLHCQRGAGSRLQLLDQRGVVFEQDMLEEDVIIEHLLPTAGSLYVRAELRSREERMRALTNPIYLQE